MGFALTLQQVHIVIFVLFVLTGLSLQINAFYVVKHHLLMQIQEKKIINFDGSIIISGDITDVKTQQEIGSILLNSHLKSASSLLKVLKLYLQAQKAANSRFALLILPCCAFTTSQFLSLSFSISSDLEFKFHRCLSNYE